MEYEQGEQGMMAIRNRVSRSRGGRVACALLAVSMVLSACADDVVNLPGKRESIRSVTSDAPETLAAAGENQSRAIALGGGAVNADWTQSPGTPAFRATNPALSASPQLAWSAGIGEGDSRKRRITAAPVVAGGLVYTLDAGTTVTATSTGGGRVWQNRIDPLRDGDDSSTGGGLAVKDGRLYVSLGVGIVVALDAGTGGEIWRQGLDATASGAPTAFGDLVYVTSGDDTGWALNATDGRVAWQATGTPDTNNVLGAPAPAVSDDLAIFAFGSGEVQALFRQGGLRRWEASVLGQRFGRSLSTVGDVTGAPVISGQSVFVGNQSGRVVALNLGSGARRWTADEGAIGPIVPAGDSVFLVSDINQLLRLDAATGERIWAADLPNFVKERPRRRAKVFANHGPVVAGGRVLVASDDGVLRSFDPTNGTLVATVDIPGGATSDPVVAGGVLYVVSKKGQLHAFR
jgi:outer membrane protein assembly factor BamB